MASRDNRKRLAAKAHTRGLIHLKKLRTVPAREVGGTPAWSRVGTNSLCILDTTRSGGNHHTSKVAPTSGIPNFSCVGTPLRPVSEFWIWPRTTKFLRFDSVVILRHLNPIKISLFIFLTQWRKPLSPFMIKRFDFWASGPFPLIGLHGRLSIHNKKLFGRPTEYCTGVWPTILLHWPPRSAALPMHSQSDRIIVSAVLVPTFQRLTSRKLGRTLQSLQHKWRLLNQRW